MYKIIRHIIPLFAILLAIGIGTAKAQDNGEKSQFQHYIQQCKDSLEMSPYVAVEYAAQAKQLAEASGDSLDIAVAYTWLGKCYYMTRVYYLAMNRMFKAFEIYSLLDKQEQLAACFVDIARVYYRQEVMDIADEYCLKAIKICDTYNYPKTKADAFKVLGQIYTLTNEDLSIPHLAVAKHIYDSLGLSTQSANINISLAEAYARLNMQDSAFSLLDYNLKKYSTSNDRRSIAQTYFAFGASYEDLNQSNKALDYYEKARIKFDSCRMVHDMLNCLIKIANIQLNQKEYDLALYNANKALHIAQEEENRHGSEEIIVKHLAYQVLYNVYSLRGNNDLALKYCEMFAESGDSVYMVKKKERFSEFQVSMESQRLQKQIEMLQVNSEKEKLLIEKSQSNRNIIFLFIIIALVIAVVIIYYFRYKEKVRHNADLSQSNSRMEQEIKERKIAETELRNSEEKYRLLFRKTPVGIVQFNDKHIITAVNERFIQIFGLKNTSLVGQDIYTVIPQKQVETMEADDNPSSDNVTKHELKVNTPNGEVFASVSYKSYADNTGTNIEKGGILIIEDITERKKAEEHLASYNSASNTIIDLLPESIFMLDNKANYVFARIPGVTMGEQRAYLGKNMREKLPPDLLLPFLVAFNTVKKTGETQYAEYEVAGDSPNQTVYNEAEFTKCEGDKVLVVIRDISRQKIAESRLKKAKHTAESGSKAKNDFILGIATELKSPIESILLNCEQLAATITDVDSSYKLKQAINSALMVNETFADLLKFTEVEAIKKNYVKAVNPMVLARGVFDIFRTRADEKNLKYQFTSTAGVPSSLQLDEIRLRQILFNILSNGIKYTEKGTVKLHISSTGHEDSNTVDLTFSVEDTGSGLSQEQIDAIFSDPNAKKGMPLTKKMADTIGATISVKSEVGKGSVFSITIPNLENEQPMPTTDGASGQHESKSSTSRRKNSDAMHEYISVLKDSIMPEYHNMEHQMSFELLQSFATKFREHSAHYNIEKGVKLADELSANIRNYDIPNITRNIRNIEAYIQTNIKDLQGE